MLDNSKKYVSEENLKKYTEVLNQKNKIQQLSVQSNINANTKRIEDEKERAENSENILQSNIDKETERALSSESSLDSKIDETKNNLIEYIDKKDNGLDIKINNEIKDRKSEISRLELDYTNKLAAQDTQHRNDLGNQINTIAGQVRSEYQNADQLLQQQITAEKDAREKFDLNQDAVNDSINKRITEEVARLDERVNQHIIDYEQVTTHISNKNNPHEVTREQIGASSQEDYENLDQRVTNIEDNIVVKGNSNGETQSIDSNISISGNLNIQGDLTFNGKAHTIDTETLQVKDNFIIINSDGEELGESQLSGLSIRVDSENAYGIAYDKRNQSISLGYGNISNGDFTFKEGESKPILTRAVSGTDELKDGAMLVWDDARKIAVAKEVVTTEKLQETFSTWTAYNTLVDEVRNNDVDILNLQNIKQNIQENSLKTNSKTIPTSINEIHDQLEEHESNTDNPHNVRWNQINQDALNNINPLMDGEANPGTSTTVSRSDHVHPIDISRAPINHLSASTQYGKATNIEYGHVIVDDSISDISENPVQNKIVKKYIDDTILNLEVESFNLNVNETLSDISQIDGKIVANKQSIQINQDQVNNLEDDLKNIKDNSDRIEDDSKKRDENLQSNIDVVQSNLNSETNRAIEAESTLQQNINNEASERLNADNSLNQIIDNCKQDLNSAIEADRQRITILENSMTNAIDMNNSIDQIKEQIESGSFSYNQRWVLSFRVNEDAAGNKSYEPYFTTLDDGELSE